jgi:hypothetical protein
LSDWVIREKKYCATRHKHPGFRVVDEYKAALLKKSDNVSKHAKLIVTFFLLMVQFFWGKNRLPYMNRTGDAGTGIDRKVLMSPVFVQYVVNCGLILISHVGRSESGGNGSLGGGHKRF